MSPLRARSKRLRRGDPGCRRDRNSPLAAQGPVSSARISHGTGAAPSRARRGGLAGGAPAPIPTGRKRSPASRSLPQDPVPQHAAPRRPPAPARTERFRPDRPHRQAVPARPLDQMRPRREPPVGLAPARLPLRGRRRRPRHRPGQHQRHLRGRRARRRDRVGGPGQPDRLRRLGLHRGGGRGRRGARLEPGYRQAAAVRPGCGNADRTAVRSSDARLPPARRGIAGEEDRHAAGARAGDRAQPRDRDLPGLRRAFQGRTAGARPCRQGGALEVAARLRLAWRMPRCFDR